MPGWSLVTEPEHYEADNLWEYINGQADFFIDYGFARVETAEYRNDQESSSVVLEVYLMGRPQEAFGIFAAERTRDDRPLEIGAQAYLGANVLGFWQAEQYVKLTSFDDGPEVERLLIGLAEEISSRIPSQGRELETLLLFPEEGRIEASERFIPKNFLGQPYLTDSYRVGYTFDSQHLQLFVAETGSTERGKVPLHPPRGVLSRVGSGERNAGDNRGSPDDDRRRSIKDRRLSARPPPWRCHRHAEPGGRAGGCAGAG